MLKIIEHGITEREKWRVFTKKPICSSSTNQFNSVSLIDCYMALLILCYGLGASVMVLAAENVIARKCCLPRCRIEWLFAEERAWDIYSYRGPKAEKLLDSKDFVNISWSPSNALSYCIEPLWGVSVIITIGYNYIIQLGSIFPKPLPAY